MAANTKARNTRRNDEWIDDKPETKSKVQIKMKTGIKTLQNNKPSDDVQATHTPVNESPNTHTSTSDEADRIGGKLSINK